MTNVGTPDWQYGVVSAGMLLASVPSGTTSVVVDLPPNTQAVMVVASGANWSSGLICVGQKTNIQYPGVLRSSAPGVTADDSAVFDVSSQVDTSVKIEWGLSPGPVEWYVYSSAGVKIVSDISLALIVQPDGVSPSGAGVMVMGFDGSFARRISTDTGGNLHVGGPDTSSGLIALSSVAAHVIPPQGAG